MREMLEEADALALKEYKDMKRKQREIAKKQKERIEKLKRPPKVPL